MIRILSILFICLISACAGNESSARYSQKLDEWLGVPEANLIAKWGKPDKTEQISDFKKVLTYNKTRSFPPHGRVAKCITRFSIDGKLVESWKFKEYGEGGCK